MANWIWTIPASPNRLPFADFDYKESRIQSYEITSVVPLVQTSPSEIVLSLTRVLSRRLAAMHYLPNYVRCPLIDETLVEIIQRLAREDVQFLPVTLRVKDAEITRYSYARPLHKLPCTDVAKSVIESWIVPGETIMDASHLVFKPDCLGDKHFARDSYTSHAVVSEALKDELMATGAKGLNFCLPENMWNIYRES